MAAHDEFVAALIAGDTAKLRRIWAVVSPHLPPLTSDEDAEIVLHNARSQARSVPFRLRAWSHRWLSERGLPSGLPDGMRPRAERMFPTISEGVGISVNARSPHLKEAAGIIQSAMSDAVADAYADGKRDPAFVRARMQEARGRTVKILFGSERMLKHGRHG